MIYYRNRPRASYRQQQGVALITALLIAALVTVAAVAMASRQQLDIRRTGNMLEADQAYMYTLAAETWVTQILREDQQRSQIDTLNEDWAMKLPPLPIEGGVISGSVEDMQGRFNLNNLVDPNPTRQQTQISIFRSLLNQVSLAEEKVTFSPFVPNRVADWIDPDLNSLADGAEDLDYLNLDVPYRAANRFMASATELAAVAGVSLTDVNALLPLVAALPDNTQVNVNTAPEMVLMSLNQDITPQIAAELAEFRKETPFAQVADFVTKLRDDYNITFDGTLITVSSNYFLVSSDAAIGRTHLRMYSLLVRNSNAIDVVSRGIGTY